MDAMVRFNDILSMQVAAMLCLRNVKVY